MCGTAETDLGELSGPDAIVYADERRSGTAAGAVCERSTVYGVAVRDCRCHAVIIDSYIVHGSSPVATALGSFTFGASPDHVIVTSYEVRIRPSGSSTIVATQNLGKPTPDEDFLILVNIAQTLNPLPTGNYTAAVAAIAPGGTTESSSTSEYFVPLA
jgi:hypothetical protein